MKKQIIIEPFVLFDNLAQGVLNETDEEILEWAKDHDLNVSDIAEENKKHLKNAIKQAREVIEHEEY